jgi:hypothetical protein
LKKALIATFIVLFLPLLVVAQTRSIKGLVLDGQNAAPLPGATVQLKSTNDTTQIYGAVTRPNGTFSISGLKEQTFILIIRSIGYTTYRNSIQLANRENDLGTFRLVADKQLLQEVEVSGTMERATMKGDTTQFNADAFKVNPDANAEDLIKKMPGVEIDGGTIKAQGEDVKMVMVDGKPFFGNDPNAALKNLPAQSVEKVEVFDRQSDQAQFTGFDDGEEQKTINIVTRPEFRNGTFGRVYGGYGTDERYQAGGNVNNFNDDQRLSIVGMSNNVNQQNFGNEDLLGVVGTSANQGGRGRWRRGPSVDSDPNDFMVGSQSGINVINSFGLNFSDDWGKKIKMNSSYFFNRTDNNTEQFISQNTFVDEENNQLYRSSAIGDALNTNHRFNLRMEYNMNEKDKFIFTPNASLQLNESSSLTNASTTDDSGGLLNTSINNYASNLNGYNLGGNFLWMHKFDKKGRTLSINLRGNATDNHGNTELLARNEFYASTVDTVVLAQEGLPNEDGKRLSTRMRYTEPIGKNSQLQISHDYDLKLDNSNRETYNFDPDSGERLNLDTAVSNVFTSIYQENEFGLTYRYNTRGFNIGVGAEYQYATLSSDLQFPQTGEINRTFQNIQPFAFMRYSLSKQKKLRLYYRASTDEPSVTQLQDVVNNSNPLQLTIGNPNLQQAYVQRIVLRYSSAQPSLGKSFNAFAYVRNTNNYITNTNLVAEQDTLLPGGVVLRQGSQLTFPINLDGYWLGRGSVNWGLPAAFLLSNVNLSTGFNYTRRPGLINNQPNISNTYGITQRVSITSNFSEKVDFNVGISANINLVYNSLQPELNNNYYVQTINVGFNYIFWKGIVFRTSFNHQWYAGLDEDFNQNFALWNASLGKKIFKNQQGEISISVFDILNQNQSITRNVTESFVEDVQTLVLQQYFMVTFTYNIRAFRGDK